MTEVELPGSAVLKWFAPWILLSSFQSHLETGGWCTVSTYAYGFHDEEHDILIENVFWHNLRSLERHLIWQTGEIVNNLHV